MKSAKRAGLSCLLWVVPFALFALGSAWLAKAIPALAIFIWPMFWICVLIVAACLFYGVWGLYLGTHPRAWKKWEAGHQKWQ